MVRSKVQHERRVQVQGRRRPHHPDAQGGWKELWHLGARTNANRGKPLRLEPKWHIIMWYAKAPGCGACKAICRSNTYVTVFNARYIIASTAKHDHRMTIEMMAMGMADNQYSVRTTANNVQKQHLPPNT